MGDDQTFHDAIEGYCSELSYVAGEVVELRVSTRANFFDIQVERWGALREVVWAGAGHDGQLYEPPVDADSKGCGWPVAVEIPVDASWRSGFYLVTLSARWADRSSVESGREVSHACFVVRAGETPTAKAVLVLATNTWNAYNTWGGRSLYTGGHQVSFGRPFGRGMLSRPHVDRDDRKARPTRYGETPDADGAIFQDYRTTNHYPSAIGSTGWFTHERRFVEWAEGAGYELDYVVSSDLDDDSSVLNGYSLVLSAGHDEYWSKGQRDAVEAHVAGGGGLATFSGNTMFWQVRLDDDGADSATTMTCYKYRAHRDDPVVAAGQPELASGLWADPLIARPEWSLLGAGSAFGLYHRFGQATPRGVGGFVIYRNDHWLLAETGLGYGDVLGAADGIVGYETVGCPVTFDEYQLPIPLPRDDLPADLEIVAFTPSSNLGVGEYPASIAALSDQGDLEFLADRLHGGINEDSLAKVRNGNAVMAVCRPYGEDGGEVVTVGTTDWVFGLPDDPLVGRVTANVFDRFIERW